VFAVGQQGNSVIRQTRGSAPDGNIAALQADAPQSLTTLGSAEQEHGGKPEGHGDDWRRKVAFVLILMRRKLGVRLVAVDQADVGSKSA